MNNAINESPTESHILDEIPIYLTGGLNADERKSLESHVAGCPECAAAMFDAKAMDESLRSLFDNVSPGRGFEDRMVAGFRQKTTRHTLHPMVRRAAIGVAASILLSSAGYFFQRNMQQLERMRSASNMRQMGLATLMYSEAAGQGQAFQEMTRDQSVARARDYFNLDGRAITSHNANVTAPSASERFQGQNVLHGDGHVEFQSSPWAGTYRGSAPASSGAIFANPSRSPAASTASPQGNGSLPQDIYDSVLLPTAGDGNFASSPSVANKDGQLRSSIAVGNAMVSAPPTSSGIGVTLGSVSASNKSGEVIAQLGAPFSVDRSTITPALLSRNQIAAANLKRDEEEKENASSTAPPSVTPADAPATTTPPTSPPSPDESEVVSRKIIREGEMTFEIDSFDSTVMNIGKIVAEEGGFVSTTDSDKLANGKVKGTVVVRVPPDHLDTLVLKLRGIGDLKSQKITAQDITKQYTDLESELRAARAMQDRLLDIIKNGKGAVKDLLEAEKQLGVWREKIEQVEGELRYDNNLVSLSTLSISLIERDIKSAAFSSINEQVTIALETEKVEEAYNATREAIDNAKGRIIQSELKQYDAGQFGATIRAQLPPDAADAVIGRIRQLDGRIANFQRERNQSNEEGSAAPLDASKVKREDVTLSLTIYNLANIAPRRTTTLTLAAGSVEDAYAAILDQAAKAGARVVTSDLNRSRPDQSTGTITLSAPSEKADALLASVRGAGEMLAQENSDNPDTQNVTSAKRGLIVQLISVASVQARQSETLQLAAADVPGAFASILDALRAADARIIASQLNQQDPANKSATIAFDIPRIARPPIDGTIDKVGEIVARNITRSQDTANTLDSKIHVEMTLQSADTLPARETTTLGVEVPDVQKSVDDLVSVAGDLGGREIDKDISQDQNGRSVAHVIVEVPLDKADGLSERIESWGHRRSKEMSRNPQAPVGKLARGRLEVTLADAAVSFGGQETTWDAIHNGLSVSGQGLRWSMQMLVVGFCFVAPWAIALWIGWRIFRRGKTRSAVGAVSKSA
jgi:hypothetical protein